MSQGMTIQVERFGPVARLTFANSPLNYATVGLLSGLADALEAFDRDADIRAIVLASAGSIFCAGGDLASPDGFGAAGSDPIREFYDQVARLFVTAKPIVAAVQGAAVGAGLGLAVAADFRVACPEARFGANFVKLGFHPGFALSCTLPRVIGEQRASTMMLTGARYRPDDAAIAGLVDRLVATERLSDAALGLAAEIAENAPLSLLATRATMRGDLAERVRAALTHEHAEQMKLQPTEDYAEGVRAVNERRPGVFKGR